MTEYRRQSIEKKVEISDTDEMWNVSRKNRDVLRALLLKYRRVLSIDKKEY
jgi:hypothetical protein